MGCFEFVTELLERYRVKKPDGVANQSRKLKKAEKKAKKERKSGEKKAKKEKKSQKAARDERKRTPSGRRHRSPPPIPKARRKLRSPPPARCMTPRDVAADLEKSTGLNARVGNSGIAYTLDFRTGTPARKPQRLRPLARRQCAFSFEENALMWDILYREQTVRRRERAKLESSKCLEAEHRRQEAQTQKCDKVNESQSKFVRSVRKRKKNLVELAQKTLDMRADLVLRSVRSARTRRAMAKLERREERRQKEAREEEDIVDENRQMEDMDDN